VKVILFKDAGAQKALALPPLERTTPSTPMSEIDAADPKSILS